MNYIDQLPPSAKLDKIIKMHDEKQKWVSQNKKGFLRYRLPFEALQNFPAANVDCNQDAVMIGTESEVSQRDQQTILG